MQNPEDEFGRLATVFNGTLARLQDSFERMRRFTADASHELRTPLTAMRSVGEVALHDSLDPAAYRDVIGSMLEAVGRPTALVETLLTPTRLDANRTCMPREVVDLRGLAASASEHLWVLAEEKAQTLTLEADGAVTAECDPRCSDKESSTSSTTRSSTHRERGRFACPCGPCPPARQQSR